MTKSEKVWLKRTLTGMNKKLIALDKSLIIVHNMIVDTEKSVTNLLLVVEETQRQQRASSGTLKVIDGGKITPRVRDPRKEPARSDR